MAFIFPSSQIGRFAALSDPTGIPASMGFYMFGWLGARIENCLITGVTISTAANYQFLMTLSNFTYVYIFGEKVGDATITGLALKQCPEGPLVQHGISRAMQFYNTHGLSVVGIPILITMGRVGFRGFLVGGTFAATNPQDNIGSFSFKFKLLHS